MTNPAAQLRLFRSGQGSGPRYGSLLLILIFTYLLSAVTAGQLVSVVQVLLFLAVVLIALRTGRFRRRTGQIIAVVLLLGSAASAIIRLVDNKDAAAALASLWTALILLLAVFYIVRQVLAQPEITEQSIYGVVSAYMMIGLIFAAVYLAMFSFSHDFFVNGTNDPKTFQYFSFTTLTTLGYGDFTAATDTGRAVAVLEAIAGQMFLATLVARLVAGFRWSNRAAARHGRVQAAPGANQDEQAGGTGSGPGESRPAAAPLPPGPGGPEGVQPSPGRPRPGSGRSRAKKASAPGLVRLSPPGAVRGRGTGQRPGARKGTGGSGPVPSPRPTERD
jgi:hypothetical protein